MTVLEKMRARLDKDGPQGSPCNGCGVSALECQIAFLESSEKLHCCATCKTHGARQCHAR